MASSNNSNKPLPIVPLAELAKHKRKTDAWISLKGKVYDITFYLKKHPGGVEPLLNYLGKDGTKAFNSVHPYVNFQKILKGHEKGILEGTPQPARPKEQDDRHSHSHSLRRSTLSLQFRQGGSTMKVAVDDFEEDKEHDVVHVCCGCFKTKDDRYPTTEFYNSPGAVVYEIKFDQKTLELPSCEEEWSIGLEPDGKIFTVKKFVDVTHVWIASYRIINPVSFKYLGCEFSDKFNTCKITLQKTELDNNNEIKWRKLGVPRHVSHAIELNTVPKDLYTAVIVYKEALSYNTNMYGIQVRPCVKFGLLIGHHINLHLKDLVRSYTPVCFSILGKSPPSYLSKKNQTFWFIIKTYKTWGLTEKLDQIPVRNASTTSAVAAAPTIKISSPQGSFDRRWLSQNPHKSGTPTSVLVMFAAGTGLTAMIRILQNISNRLQTGQRCFQSQVILLFWNKSEDDIIWNRELTELSKSKTLVVTLGGGVKGGGKQWFTFIPILTHPSKNWTGLTGRASQEHVALMETKIPGDDMAHSGRQALICGPTGFCQAVQRLIGGNFNEANIYVFPG